MPGAYRLRVFDAAFDADIDGHFVNGFCVERGGKPDRLGEFRGPVGRDTV